MKIVHAQMYIPYSYLLIWWKCTTLRKWK